MMPPTETGVPVLELAVTPACWRCGYDLSGHIAAWTMSCPVEGVCSECGLTFRWGEFLKEIQSGPAWSYEHGARHSWRRLGITLLLTLVPWALWRRLELRHEVMPRRLLLIAAVSCVIVHLVAGLLVVVNDQFAANAFFSREPQPIGDVFLWPYNKDIRWGGNDFHGALIITWVLVAAWATYTLSMLVLSETFRAARLRWVHLLRGAAYSLLPCGLVGVALPVLFMLSMDVAPLWDRSISAVLFLSIPLWPGLWWWFFTGRYLRLNAAVIVPVMTIVSGLATAVVTIGLIVLLNRGG